MMIFLPKTARPEEVRDALRDNKVSQLVLEVGKWLHPWTEVVEVPRSVELLSGISERDYPHEGSYAEILLAGARIDSFWIQWVMFRSLKPNPGAESGSFDFKADIPTLDAIKRIADDTEKRIKRMVTRAICDAARKSEEDFNKPKKEEKGNPRHRIVGFVIDAFSFDQD